MRNATRNRAVTFENIGAALSVLQRLDSLPLDDDIWHEVTRARQILSVIQSRIHAQLQGAST